MICIEVVVPNDHLSEVEPTLVHCCSETGDILLGRQMHPTVDEQFFLVMLVREPNLSNHLPILSYALHNQLITSFEFTRGGILRLSAPDIQKRIEDFPRSFGDSWVASHQKSDEVYLHIHRNLLTEKQSSWILLQKIQWEYL